MVAESLAVKHQLLIMKRSRRRAPNLTSWDRLLLGFYLGRRSPGSTLKPFIYALAIAFAVTEAAA
jgi:hypothetical protein